MERYTTLVEEKYEVDEKDMQRAVERLAVFEGIYENIVNEQTLLSEQMAVLRAEGKEKSVKFKELMVKKLNNSNVISLFKANGL